MDAVVEIKLSAGSVAALMRGENVDGPVLQVLSYRRIFGNDKTEQIGLNISDGIHSYHLIKLASELKPMITEGLLDINCVIKVEKLAAVTVSDKRIIILGGLEVIVKGSIVGKTIGSPVPYTVENANLAQQPTTAVESEFPDDPSTSVNGQPKQAAAPQPPSTDRNSLSGSLADTTMIPIRDITPINSKCTIKAKVTSKSDVAAWSSSRGDGKLFSMDLLDESGEIRMTGFDSAVEEYFDLITENGRYLISHFSVKKANKKLSSLDHDYEIQFTDDTQLVPCVEP